LVGVGLRMEEWIEKWLKGIKNCKTDKELCIVINKIYEDGFSDCNDEVKKIDKEKFLGMLGKYHKSVEEDEVYFPLSSIEATIKEHNKDGIKEVTLEKINSTLDNPYGNEGLMYCEDKNCFLALDNRTPDNPILEEFDTKEKTIDWLKGKFEVV